MFEKNMRVAYLLDVYGEVLDEHTKGIMKAYYEDDLSLSEIALDEKISRQGVRHVIKKAEEQLDYLEDKLKLCELFEKIEAHNEAVTSICDELRGKETTDAAQIADRILSSLALLNGKQKDI